MNKKLLISGALVSMLLFNNQTQTNAEVNFKDLPVSYHAETQLEYLIDQNVINGYADGTFRPNEMVTRGQFAAFVSRALKLEKMSVTFKDVPKTASLHEGISKAATAGIIKGFADGTFKPNAPVTRADIAVMLDRAMQLKGKFTQTKSVSYSDYNLIKGGYADTSIKRMSFYGVMGTYSNGLFSPKVEGTREATVLSIYNMLKVIDSGNPMTPPEEIKDPGTTKPYYEMTLAELKQTYGETILKVRQDQYKEGVITRDLMAEYDKNFKNLRVTPEEYLNKDKWAGYFISEYRVFYPAFEVISINGVPFTDTEFYNEDDFDFETAFTLPKSPKEEGQFYIDYHTNKMEFARYTKGRADVAKVKEPSYVKDGSLMVDMSLFLMIPNSSMSGGTFEFNGTKAELVISKDTVMVNGVEHNLSTKVDFKNKRLMVPLRSFAKAIGLQTYTVDWANRIEITNYPLETIEGLREQ